jgi:hypothetical protein
LLSNASFNKVKNLLNSDVDMSELQHMLNDGVRFDPHYLPDLNSDHLPMTLCAMSGLGASTSTLHAFRDSYMLRLRPVEGAPAIENWRDAIGDASAYDPLRVLLLEQVERLGISALVRQYLPEFSDSIALEAFHPLIRLGYAIDFESPVETAAALAYLITSHRPVSAGGSAMVDFRDALDQQALQKPAVFTSVRFGDRVLELAENGDYPNVTARSFAECAAGALAVYMGTRNFFALHMVTATHAARICARVLVDPTIMLASLSNALLAAHGIVGNPEFDSPVPVPQRLDPEHAFKYAWSCLSEYREYGGQSYLGEIEAFRNQELIPDWCTFRPA